MMSFGFGLELIGMLIAFFGAGPEAGAPATVDLRALVSQPAMVQLSVHPAAIRNAINTEQPAASLLPMLGISAEAILGLRKELPPFLSDMHPRQLSIWLRSAGDSGISFIVAADVAGPADPLHTIMQTIPAMDRPASTRYQGHTVYAFDPGGYMPLWVAGYESLIVAANDLFAVQDFLLRAARAPRTSVPVANENILTAIISPKRVLHSLASAFGHYNKVDLLSFLLYMDPVAWQDFSVVITPESLTALIPLSEGTAIADMTATETSANALLAAIPKNALAHFTINPRNMQHLVGFLLDTAHTVDLIDMGESENMAETIREETGLDPVNDMAAAISAFSVVFVPERDGRLTRHWADDDNMLFMAQIADRGQAGTIADTLTAAIGEVQHSETDTFERWQVADELQIVIYKDILLVGEDGDDVPVTRVLQSLLDTPLQAEAEDANSAASPAFVTVQLAAPCLWAGWQNIEGTVTPETGGARVKVTWRMAPAQDDTSGQYPMPHTQRQPAQVTAMNNLRNLALCYVMYKADHGKAPTEIDDLRPYADAELSRLAVCPVSGRTARMLPAASDAQQTAGNRPVFWYPPIPDGDGGGVAFTDGRVEWLKQAELEALDLTHSD